LTQSTQELTMNKLIILFLIHHMKIPLSNTQITEFMLERDYTDFFSIQQYLTELVDAKLLQTQVEEHTTRYEIEPKGQKTLEYFLNRIPFSVQEEILHYVQTNRPQVRKEIEILAEYCPQKRNEYLVTCKAMENKTLLMEIKLTAFSKKQAQQVCDNWKKNASILYGKFLSSLMKDSSID